MRKALHRGAEDLQKGGRARRKTTPSYLPPKGVKKRRNRQNFTSPLAGEVGGEAAGWGLTRRF